MEAIMLLLPCGEANYFCAGGWTRDLENCPAGKSVAAQSARLTTDDLLRARTESVFARRGATQSPYMMGTL